VTEERPSPEEMLARAAEEEARARRGRLKIYFGMAPGVGKTYAMLEEGLRRRRPGLEVVIGWVETHGRIETEALASRLDRIPAQTFVYRGVELPEFDVEAALARKPGLLLVDELPHTNAPGSRHPKRWQDVEELLEAGIDVHTTLNVQHLESVNDVVAQITGVVVRETVPDALFDKADEIELVDLPPDDLLKRLEEGKVYLGDASVHAATHFFQKGNLIALRELALRRSTERVDAQVDAWRREHGIAVPWSTGERLLVAVGSSASARDVVRAAYRMATRLHAPWIALHVETSAGEADRDRVMEILAFAEQLGAETAVVRGEGVADEIVKACRQRNVARVVLGRPDYGAWRSRIRGTLVKALVRQAEGIDVLVTSGTPESPDGTRAPITPPSAGTLAEWIEALVWVAGATLVVSALDRWVSDADRALIYVFAVLVAATRVGTGPSLFAAASSVVAYDFLFVSPRYTFSVSDARYVVTFLVMLAVGVIVGRLTMRIRRQAESAVHRERRTAALYALSRELATETDPGAIARTAARHVRDHLGCTTVVWVREPREGLHALEVGDAAVATDERELAVARWVLEHQRAAGRGTDTLPYARALYLPLVGSAGPIGAVALVGESLAGDQRLLADTFARQTALALERALLTAEAEQARIAVETERLRNELLSAVSHDLRTPLASITGSATALIESDAVDPAARLELLHTIREESELLGRLVADLLDLTRIESGTVQARREWVPVEEVIDVALGRLEAQLAGREVTVDVPEEMLTAPMDATLVGQVLLNLLENAAKHTPAGGPLAIVARSDGARLMIEVLDRGNGIPAGEEERIFEKFYRTADGRRVPGTGLGLAIARAVVRAHGGAIRAENRDGGGARFVVELPIERPSS